MKITTGELAAIVEGTVEGDPHVLIYGPSTIEEGIPGTVSFLSNPKYEQFLYSTNASAVLVHENFSPLMKLNTNLIRVKDVGMSITKLFEHFSSKREVVHTKAKEAFIDPTAKVHPQSTIGIYAVISSNAIVGRGSVIHSQVFIGENVVIGEDVIIYPGVKIYHDCEIGDNSIIHSNAVIGSDGFGFTKNSDGNYDKIPHLGKVIIENDVEIGSNTVIDRGTLGNTIIKEGVKLDNLIQIAHNVELGKNTVIAAQSGIAGSTKVGEECVIGGQTGIIGHIKIADGTKIQAQSGVAGTVKEKNTKLYGTPALPYQNYLKSYAHFKALPTLHDQVKELQRQIEQLKQSIISKNPE